MNFLVEMGGDIGIYENGKKLIAAAGLDPSTYQSGKYEGESKISKRGNRHLRRVIWIMATWVLVCNGLFKTYFRKRRKEGVTPQKDSIGNGPQTCKGDVLRADPQDMFFKRGN